MNMLDNMYLKAKIFFGKKKELFLSEERGAVDIIAIVVLIGIVVILAGLFKDELLKLIKTLLANITGDAEALTDYTPTPTGGGGE